MLFLGFFLILAGIAGFVSNPEGAKTALLSGGFFGSLCLVWSFLFHKEFAIARPGAIATMGLLIAAFIWRSTVGWLEVAAGNQDKLFAASLISAMLVATAVTLFRVVGKKSTS